ncbi:MAG: hypothetical protein ACPGVT_06490 [Maricaulaceae bacterium]
MTYTIIKDRSAFESFVAWLPEIDENEAYYLTLLARKKYHESALSDKSALKRFVATSKSYLVQKVNQLELPKGLYLNKAGNPIHEEALALYISVNPRDLKLAQKTLLKRLVDVALDPTNLQNPAALALSEIQKSKSRGVFVDFDFDINDVEIPQTAEKIKSIIGKDAVKFLRTRGGFHALVTPKIAAQNGPKKWHQEISSLAGCDVVGDSLIPVPGSYQGGFTPYFF